MIVDPGRLSPEQIHAAAAMAAASAGIPPIGLGWFQETSASPFAARSLNPCGQDQKGRFNAGNTCAKGEDLSAFSYEEVRARLPVTTKGMSDDEIAGASKARRELEKSWESSMLAALSEGRITAETAIERGLSKSVSEKFVPLPEVLYHVTVAGDKVAAEGLKSPYQRRGGGEGLGGGDEHAVCLTTSARVANGIRDGMLEAKDVIDGKITPEDLIAQAREGGWLPKLEKWALGKFGVPLAKRFGSDPRVSVDTPGDVAQFGMATRDQVDPSWIPDGDPYTGAADGVPRWRQWLRPATLTERRDAAFDLYRANSLHREVATGRYDPFFAFGNLDAFAAVDRSQIRIFRASPASPESKGERIGGPEAEYRIFSGKAVTLKEWDGKE